MGVNEPKEIDHWFFTEHPNQMCLPKDAENLCCERRKYQTGMSSADITSVDLDRRIVVTCKGDSYKLGIPAEKYVKFIEKMNSEFLSFKVVLNNWDKENKFMQELERI